jgi:predicted O-methyltransferase YrrM
MGRGLFLRATNRVADAFSSQTAVDLVVSSVFNRGDLPPLGNARSFVGFLRESIDSQMHGVDVIRPDGSSGDRAGLRFRTLLKQLKTDVPPVPLDMAVRIGLIADELTSSLEPVDVAWYAGDVGLHATLSSSFARKGRILRAVVRFSRARTAFEIGTCYGMSALFLASALPNDGRLGTVESAHPQIDISQELLKREEPDRIVAYAAFSTDVVDQVGRDLGQIDFMFHDGNHTRERYVDDFEVFEPLLASGSIVLYDDIRWEDSNWSPEGPAHAYEGWREVADHPRVREAVELDGALGLLLLR